MRMVKLAMPQACNSAVKRTALVRSRRKAQPRPIGSRGCDWFKRRSIHPPRYLQGGTYLFDACGSMGLSADRLNTLCKSVPAATVAYYSGWGGAAPMARMAN